MIWKYRRKTPVFQCCFILISLWMTVNMSFHWNTIFSPVRLVKIEMSGGTPNCPGCGQTHSYMWLVGMQICVIHLPAHTHTHTLWTSSSLLRMCPEDTFCSRQALDGPQAPCVLGLVPHAPFFLKCYPDLVKVPVTKLCPTSGLYPSRLLCPWDSPGRNTGVGCHALLQESFLTQKSNLHLLWRILHC